MEGNYTNHSGKRTCATQLYLAGVDEQDIMARTGHRSEKAVRKYKQTCPTFRKRVSKVLDPPSTRECQENKENTEQSLPVKVQKMTVDDAPANAMTDITNRPYFNNCQISFNYESLNKQE